VASSRRAVLARDWPASEGPVKIAVVTEDSNTFRSMLRRIGFDLLIRRPVHPYALRLVLLRALYRGAERRKEGRVAVGYQVSLRMGLRRKGAVLADLSLRGARLLCPDPVPPGRRLTLQIAREIADGKPLSLRGKVVRCEAAPSEPGFAVALAFTSLDEESRGRLCHALRARVHGPAQLPVAERPDSRGREGLGALPVAAPATETNRRKHPRAAYHREVRSLDEEAETVLMGRDLSVGGMRIDPHPKVQVGDLLQLAIYGDAEQEPFVVHAHVVRDEGGGGLGLKFEHLKPGLAAGLEALVARLPSVESLDGAEADGMGSVVSRILDQQSSPTEVAR